MGKNLNLFITNGIYVELVLIYHVIDVICDGARKYEKKLNRGIIDRDNKERERERE